MKQFLKKIVKTFSLFNNLICMKTSKTCKQNLVFPIVLFALLFLSACSNPRYINSPSVHNAAFFREQGDYKFSVAASGNPAKIFSAVNSIENENEIAGHAYGFDGQAAVAVTNHFMLTASAMYRNEKDRYDDDDIDIANNTLVSYTRQMFDVGAGFYTRMGASGRSYFNGVFGAGFGKMNSTDNAIPFTTVRDRTFDANTRKLFVHPSFNLFFSDYFRMSIAPRFSLLKLYDIQSTYTLSEETSLGYSDVHNKSYGVFEPSILMQAGFKNNDWLKLDFGFNFSTDPFITKTNDYGDPKIERDYNVKSRNFLLSLGLSFYPHRTRR